MANDANRRRLEKAVAGWLMDRRGLNRLLAQPTFPDGLRQDIIRSRVLDGRDPVTGDDIPTPANP